MKSCSRCHTAKPLDAFHRRYDGHVAACKECVNARNRERRKPSERTLRLRYDHETETKICSRCGERKSFHDYSKRSNRNGAPQAYCKACDVKYQREYRYGLSDEDWQRMWDAQSGLCASCADPLDANDPHGCNIDHCHDSGGVRGLLCLPCNLALGHLKDDEQRILALLDYLRSSRVAS